jgi:hypothetical protein
LVVLADPAPPSGIRPALGRAESLFGDAQYADSVALLDEILIRGGLSPAERREATLYLGMGHVALGQEDAARAQFREVLTEDSSYALPRYTSPKIRALFERVREEVRGAPQLVALGPLIRPMPTGPERVQLRFRADRAGDRPAFVFWRRRGEAAYLRAPLSGGTLRAVEIPLTKTAGDGDFDLEYYAEMRDGDRPVARAGSPEQPLAVRVHVGASGATAEVAPSFTPPHTPIYRRWWFWGAVVAVAAGGAVAAYLATQSDSSSTGELDVHFQISP